MRASHVWMPPTAYMFPYAKRILMGRGSLGREWLGGLLDLGVAVGGGCVPGPALDPQRQGPVAEDGEQRHAEQRIGGALHAVGVHQREARDHVADPEEQREHRSL